MQNFNVEWVDAETPHAKILRHALTPAPEVLRAQSPLLQSALDRIQSFEARVSREAATQPLVVAELA